MRIGLTGGIGCGKSTVAKLLEAQGLRRIDSDAVVHELLAADAEVIAEVLELLGPEVALPSGGIDRSAVGRRVFASEALLRKLESILHPRVRRRWERESERCDSVIEIPLLFEKNLQKNVDTTVCVFSDLGSQVDRLASRGMSREDALARIKQQMPLSEKVERADYVLLNVGTLSFLEEQVRKLATKLDPSTDKD